MGRAFHWVGSSLVVLLAVLVSSAGADRAPEGAVPGSGEVPSVHRLALEAHRDVVPIPFAERSIRRVRRGAAGAAAVPIVQREVLGFLPYWVNEGTIRWDLLTTLAYFAIEANADGTLGRRHGWPDQSLVQEAHANGVRVVIAVTNFSGSELSTLLGSATYRSRLIANIYDQIAAGGADGVNIDFEGVPGSRKQQLVAFMQELRDELSARMANPHITIDTPAVDWRGAFDYDVLAETTDGLMIMGYGYHYSGSSQAGPVSPLQGWGTYNLKWTLSDYFEWGGAQNRDKFILGLPWYGYTWRTADAFPHSDALAQGTSITYAGARSGAATYGREWDGESLTPWYTYVSGGQRYQVWYDDAESSAVKYDEVKARDIGGIGIWALGYEGSSDDMWLPIESAFGGAASGTVAAVDGPTRSTAR